MTDSAAHGRLRCADRVAGAHAGRPGTALVERLRLTAVSAGQALLGIPALRWRCSACSALPLRSSRSASAARPRRRAGDGRSPTAHRRVSGALLGEPDRAGTPTTAGSHRRPGRFVWVRDPARWRDFAFCGSRHRRLRAVAGAGRRCWRRRRHLVGLRWSTAAWLGGSCCFLSGPLLVAWWFVTRPWSAARALPTGASSATRGEELERRVDEVDRDPRRDARPLGRRAAPDRARPARRRPGPDRGGGHERRPGREAGRHRSRTPPPSCCGRPGRPPVRAGGPAHPGPRHPPAGAGRPRPGRRHRGAGARRSRCRSPSRSTCPAALPAPVESAAYFAVAECLANTVKHAGATPGLGAGRTHDGDRLQLDVGDDGRGGADPAGSRPAGVARRLAAFDGTMTVASPAGGPTVVTLEVPCRASI